MEGNPILSHYFGLRNVSRCNGAAIAVFGVLRTEAEFSSLMSPVFVWRMIPAVLQSAGNTMCAISLKTVVKGSNTNFVK